VRRDDLLSLAQLGLADVRPLMQRLGRPASPRRSNRVIVSKVTLARTSSGSTTNHTGEAFCRSRRSCQSDLVITNAATHGHRGAPPRSRLICPAAVRDQVDNAKRIDETGSGALAT